MASALVVLFSLIASSLALAPLYSTEKDIEGSFIVVFNPETTKEQLSAEIAQFASLSGISAIRTYIHTIKGFHAMLTPEQLDVVRKNPNVKFVEGDKEMRVLEESQSCTLQSGAPWGLNRISERTISLDGIYSYPSSAGLGVNVYIVDTGILVTHTDFGGRATFAWKAESSWSSSDANGHGTHVASTIGGIKYGVAKKTTLFAVKVLGDNGSGSNAGVIGGIDYVAGQRGVTGKPTVINMSLGGSKSTALNAAVDSASADGVVVVVAAGNDASDACSYSPASANSAVSVGASDTSSDSNDEQYDVRSSFSNFGTCVDLFAPGSDITAAWIGSPLNSAIRTISGTSMASPHVAGVAALVLGANSGLSPSQIKSVLVDTATLNAVSLDCPTFGSAACKNTPTGLVFNGCDH